jgi:hypothetical protein
VDIGAKYRWRLWSLEKGFIELMGEMGRKQQSGTPNVGAMSRSEMSLAPKHLRKMAGKGSIGFSIVGGKVRHSGRTISFEDSLKMPPIREPKGVKKSKRPRNRIPVRKNLFKGGRIPGF